MSASSAFARLRARQPTPIQRERLTQLRDELALADHDALWSLLELVEDYCESLLQRRSQTTPSITKPGGPWRLLAMGMGTQVVLMAIAMWVGARATGPSAALTWPRCPQQAVEAQNLFAAILSAPAGWLAFVLALPALAHGMWLGWRLRAEEPLVGWIIVATSAVTSAGLVVLLLRLL